MTGHKNIRMVVKYDHERGNIEDNAINFLHNRDFSPYNATHHALGLIIAVLATDVALSIVIYGGMIPGAITNTLSEL